ncbi:TolC family protein, partial [Acinetobacter baumannii]
EVGTAIENRREWSGAIEQTFEIAGQQGHRRRAAQQELDALDASLEEARRDLHAEVEQRFVQVLALQERIATESASLKIIE